jgi:hypothetical protein
MLLQEILWHRLRRLAGAGRVLWTAAVLLLLLLLGASKELQQRILKAKARASLWMSSGQCLLLTFQALI